jgi:hypothetical protein
VHVNAGLLNGDRDGLFCHPVEMAMLPSELKDESEKR